MRCLMLQKPAAHPEQDGKLPVGIAPLAREVERQQDVSAVRLLSLADDQLVRLGGQLPVNVAHTVSGPVFAHVVYFRKAAAVLRAVGARLKAAEIRKRLRRLGRWPNTQHAQLRQTHFE